MAFKDFFSDLKETMNDRLKNPFIFSFIFSWLAWNWMLVYEVFTFDSNYSLSKRIQIISQYIDSHKSDNLTWVPLLSSFGIALMYLVFSALFTILFNFYNTTIKAAINKGTLRGDIVPVKYFKYLENKYNNLKVRSEKYITENLEFEKKINEKEENITTLDFKIKELDSENKFNLIKAKEFEIENKRLKMLIEEQDILKSKTENILSEIFNSTISYLLNVRDPHGTLRPFLREPKSIRFTEQNTVVEIKTNEARFYFDTIKLTLDGRLLSFIFREINDTKIVYQFYIIRNIDEKGTMQGHLVHGSNVYVVTLYPNK